MSQFPDFLLVKKLSRLIFFATVLVLTACHSSRNMQAEHSFTQIPLDQDTIHNSELFTHLLKNKKLRQVVANKDSFHLQIIFTQINRDANNQPTLVHHFYNVSNQYFYPASTVKFPAAVLALEKLNNLKLPGVNASTMMLTDSSYAGQSAFYNDPTSATGKASIGQYIRKIFLVSDNEAYNRLYEFIGQEPFNKRMQALGFSKTQLLHRLSIVLPEDQNRHTNGIRFIDSTGRELYNQFPVASQMNHQQRADFLGKGYMVPRINNGSDSLVNGPMDFSKKNRLPLTYLHTMLQWVMFPQTQQMNNKLNLTETDYRFLHRYMSMQPTESSFPKYDTPAYYPAYGKFLLMGQHQGAWPDSNIRIFNKIGNAYGFMTDVAYVIDKKTGVEFMLSCTLLCNADGVFNDNKYEYDSVGLPFMQALGKVIYDYEKKRTRPFKPDFSNFVFNYTD